MNLETVVSLLNNCGIMDAHAEIVKIMREPIVLEKAARQPKEHEIIQQYQIVAHNGKFTVQGVWYRDYNDVLDLLIGRRNIPDSLALRTLALAIDLADKSK